MTDEHPPTHRKVALVTGVTSGIGCAAAVSLAHRGYRIIAVGRDANRGVGVVDELERVGAGGTFLPCDLLDLADVRRLAREVSERHRRLDVLLNNAGGIFRAKALTPEGIEYTFALNAVALLTAPLLFMVVPLALLLTFPDFLPRIFTEKDKVFLVWYSVVAGLMVGIFEELGWTGFAVPKIRQRYGVLGTGLIVGLMFAAWDFLVVF